MKSYKPRSLLIDSGGGWFDSDSSPMAGVFGDPALTLCFSGEETRLFSDSTEKTSSEDPLRFVERLAAEGYTALGYISYEYFEYTTPGIKTLKRKEEEGLPLVFFHFYEQNGFYIGPCEEALSVSASSGGIAPGAIRTRTSGRRSTLRRFPR